MKNKNIFTAIFVAALAFYSTSCVNLKTLNYYSLNSVKSLKKFENLEYGFTKACNDKCQLEQLEKNELLKAPCGCRAERQADSITRAIYTAVKGYFQGLANLSDNKLTDYKFDAMAKALNEGDFGDISLTKDQVNAYGKISAVLTRAVTDAYRKKKISEYLADAHESVGILLQALQFNLVSNLSKKLDIKNERLESYYFDLSRDSTTSVYEKKKIIEEYTESAAEIKRKKRQISTYGRALKRIAEGHEELYKNRNKLNVKEIKELLSQCASDIEDIVDEFNTLKNQD